MRITLWTLNESYQALIRLSSKELPKEQHKLAYKISRICKSAKSEIEAMGESLQALQAKCGFKQGEENISPAKIEDFNQQSKKFLKETECEIWGDPIKYEDIAAHLSTSPLDLANLDWLIVAETESENQQAAAAAS